MYTKFRRYADPTTRQTKTHQFDYLETIHEKKCMKCPRTFSLLRAKALILGNKQSTTLCVSRQSILYSCGRFLKISEYLRKSVFFERGHKTLHFVLSSYQVTVWRKLKQFCFTYSLFRGPAGTVMRRSNENSVTHSEPSSGTKMKYLVGLSRLLRGRPKHT